MTHVEKSDMTPEELWREALRGHQPSWEALYRLLGGRLYQFFLKNTGKPELAMDKTQEVFERLWKHREAFIDGSLNTWVFRIARNLLIDLWRRKPRAEILAEDPPEVVDPAVGVEESVLTKLHREDMLRHIDDSLALLSEDDRLILGVVYLGGLSLPELASVMEIPLGTAKTRCRQARLRLDRLLQDRLKGQHPVLEAKENA